MDNDDQMVGRLLSRREALTLLTAASAALLVGWGPATTGTTQPTGAAGQAAGATPVPETIIATLEAAGPN